MTSLKIEIYNKHYKNTIIHNLSLSIVIESFIIIQFIIHQFFLLSTGGMDHFGIHWESGQWCPVAIQTRQSLQPRSMDRVDGNGISNGQ